VSGLLISLRPKQWAKNFLVFAGLIFGGQLFHRSSLFRALAAFIAFCVLSSAVYLINDVIDRPADRRHPFKARRPIASGRLRPLVALIVATILLGSGLMLALRLDLIFGGIALAYVLLMGVYVSALKHVVILDALAISGGFVLRAWGGAAVIHVPVSHWLLTLTLSLAMFLSLSKRRAELVTLADDASAHRRTLAGYSERLLDGSIAIITVLTLVAYGLYTVSAETVARFGTNRLLFTLPLPILGVSRYLYLVYRGAGGSDPSEHLLSDLPLLACVGLWVVAVITIIYGPRLAT
jgi:4-hydroxybenzoate polyprenyltransferase